jgi:hypothetical protein
MARPYQAPWLECKAERVLGKAEMQRAGRGFPAHRLIDEHGGVLAELGAFSWFSIYLGRGQRVRLPDGTRWRIRSRSRFSTIAPVIVDSEGRKVAEAAHGYKNYGINGRDYAYALNPDEKRRFRARRWTLRHHETTVATVGRQPRAVDAAEPIPLAVVLMSFVLIQFGIPGEEELAVPAQYA